MLGVNISNCKETNQRNYEVLLNKSKGIAMIWQLRYGKVLIVLLTL